MFGIGSTELLVILLVGLIVLGPKSLANVSRTIGRVVGEFRRVSTDFQRTLNAEAAREEQKEQMQKMSAEERRQAEHEQAEDEQRAQKLAKRRQEAEEKAAKAKQAKMEAAQNTPQPEDKAESQAPEETPSIPTPPADSPLARALAKTQAEAQASQSGKGQETTQPQSSTGSAV
ncbi:MAG: Sec-independent protein translocase protein TatB [Desulfovibrio sp.]|nr:Sec-independent protein translocase protein TatB [Desulfovibrio sp.]